MLPGPLLVAALSLTDPMALASVGAPADDGTAAAPEDPAQTAREHVARGVDAFRAEAWETALREFESARALRYSPKLDFNIAVLHEKLLEPAEDPATRSFHAAQAIAAYRGYLEAVPEASDRADVEARIEALGRPVPVVLEDPSGSRTLMEGGAGTDTDTDTGTGTGTGTAANSGKADFKTWDAVGFLHVTPMLGIAPQLLDADGTEAGGTLLLELGGGGLLGRRKLVALGAVLGGVFGGASQPNAYAFGSFHFGGTVGVSAVVTKKDRLLLDAHALAAVSRQAMRLRNDAVAPGCTEGGDTNALVGARLGFRTGARLTLGVLLGHRRRHALTFSIYPAVGVFARGSAGPAACDQDVDVFEAAGITERVTVDIWSGLGYGLRI